MRHNKVKQSHNSGSAPLFWHCSIILALSRYQDADRVVVAHQAVMVCGGSYGGLGVALQGSRGGKGRISYGVRQVLKINQGDGGVDLSESQNCGAAPELWLCSTFMTHSLLI